MTAADSETPCVCASPTTWASRTGELPQELCLWFCPLNPRLPSATAFEEIARWQAGPQTWTQTWTLQPDQGVAKVILPPKSQHKLCGIWILFKSVSEAKFEPSEVTFLRLMPHTVFHYWIQYHKFRILIFFSIFSHEFILWIHIFEFIYVNSEPMHMNSYAYEFINSESIHMNLFTWICILMNSYIHFIYEFT